MPVNAGSTTAPLLMKNAVAGVMLDSASTVCSPLIWGSLPLISIVSLVATFAGTWLTKPTEAETLLSFYQNVRPFGFWGPVRAQVVIGLDRSQMRAEGAGLALVNTMLGLVAIGGAYLAPMYFVSHNHSGALVCAGMAVVAVIALKFTWYDNLPDPEPVSESPSQLPVARADSA